MPTTPTTPELTSESAQELARTVVLSLLQDQASYPLIRVTERYHSPRSRVNLTGRPVLEVHSVTDALANPTPFELADRAALYLSDVAFSGTERYNDRRPCLRPSDFVTVIYTYGHETIPSTIQQAIDDLAAELVAGSRNEPCKLPERVTSISRQGVSWTLLDPMDFLDKGKTGIYSVDLILSAMNPGNTRRAVARVFSPEYRPPVRLHSELASTPYVPTP